MANAYVIDTSTIISNPDVVRKSRRHGVIIPGVVLRQLDGLKSSKDSNTAYWARKASQAIERQQRKGNLLIMSESVRVDTLPNKADNQIIGTALWVSRHRDRYTDRKVKNVILVSTDRNMRIAAANCGLKAEDGDDRRRKGRICARIGWGALAFAVFSGFGISLICMLFPSLENIIENSNIDVPFYSLCAMFASFAIASIMLFMTKSYYGSDKGKSAPDDEDFDEVLDNISSSPNYTYFGGNVWHR